MELNEWIRIPTDVTAFDEFGNENGKLRKTCGVKVLELGEDVIKIFSPDLNKNVYIRWNELEDFM